MKREIIKKFQKYDRKDSIYYIAICNECKKEFELSNNYYKKGRGIFCNGICNGKNKSGKKNGRWNGGVKKVRGYVSIHKNLISKKYHYLSNSNYIPEHRLIASKKYNKKLKISDIIHHLNGIRNDNRKENLVIVSSKTHENKTFEKLLKKRILKLENG